MLNGRQCVGCPLARAKNSFFSHKHFFLWSFPSLCSGAEWTGERAPVYVSVATRPEEVMAVQVILTSPALLVHHSEALKCQEAKTWICVFSFTHSKPLQGLSWQNWQTTKDAERNKGTKGIHNTSNQVSPLCSDGFIQQAFGNISHVQVSRSHIFHWIKSFVILGLHEWKIALSIHI